MAVTFRFFAQSAQWAGCKTAALPLAEPSTVRTVLAETAALAPLLGRIEMLRLAVNDEWASLDSEVKDGDEVAFIPPVSGG